MTFYDMKKIDFWNNNWVMSLTASVLLSLSFPPFDAAILQIPAFILLFRIACNSSTVRQVILYTYPAFVLWNILVTYWLMMATVAGGISAFLANSAIMLVPLLLIRALFRSKMNPILSAFFAAAIWVSYEFLHHNWDLAWPWLTLGNGWSNLTGVIQYISVTGVYGISFWVIFTAALFYNYIVEPVKPILYSALTIFFVFPIFSVLAMITAQQTDGDPINVAIVQPNSDSYQDFGGLESLDALVNKLLRQSGEIVTEETDVLIWPENALSSGLSMRSPYFSQILDSLHVWDTQLITGSGFVEYYDDNNKPEIFRRFAGGTMYNIFNAAVHLQPDSENDIYKKGRLVPVVEYFPFIEFFQRIDVFNWINWGDLMVYGLGRDANNFEVNGLTTPALICYDSVFPGWVNEFVGGGADFLTIITNDGWWGDSNGHIQHFDYARLRAIEHRMWVARSANNGISGIISPDGKVQVATEYWTEDAFTFTIYGNTRSTFYSRHGEWFGHLMVVSMFAGLIFLVYIRRRDSE